MPREVARSMTPEQDRLVTDHLNLVGYALRSMPWTRGHQDRDGLRGAASLGLVQAAAAYQPRTGVPFRHFALIRIRGAVLDEARTTRFGSRSVTEEWAAVRAASEELRAELQRDPTTAEVAGRLGWPLERVERAEARNERARLRCLDGLIDAGLQLAAADDPTAPRDAADTAAILAAGIAQLRPRLQLVIDALFFAGQRQCELAAAFGVTEARISQLRCEAVRKLRAAVLPQLRAAA